MPRWMVSAPPELPEYIDIPDFSYLVDYHYAAFVDVEADTRSEALRKAVYGGEGGFDKWVDIARGDNKNPYSGVKCELLCPVCEKAGEAGIFLRSCLLCGEVWFFLDDALTVIDPNWQYDHNFNISFSYCRFSKQKRSKRIMKWHREHADL